MFFCKECGAETPRWEGKCPVCGEWDTLRETSRVTGKKSKHAIGNFIDQPQTRPQKIADIKFNHQERIVAEVDEFDGVLGGGIVPGMVILIGGEPGIGKSTLLLQIANKLAKNGKRILYVSGEESNQQIKLRSNRLNCNADELFLYCETDFVRIIDSITDFKPDTVVIDSIQSVYMNTLDSTPGSVSQLRECTSNFTRIAKKMNIPFFLIGHVTKDGSVAGPKIIEHMVDTVLYFEGEMNDQYKILRATKNRFGSTNEIGIFEMLATGLKQVKNPSQLFMNRDSGNIGTAIGSLLEGSRAFLVEVQALVSPASYGNSQRVALGFNNRKLSVLLAVIEKNLSIDLSNNDVFIKLAGGVKVLEPALDLAIIAAIISSSKNKPIKAKTLLLGEVGLNGDVRPVSQIGKRLKEAKKMGYDNIVISDKTKNIKTKKMKNIRELIQILF